jgi:Ca-activated chloride channel homolog
MRGVLQASVTVAAAAVATTMVAAAGQQQPIRTGVDLVHFAVVVTDRQGAPITGLTADDFEVIERGQSQHLSFFTTGDPTLAPPLRIGFLLDASGSMEAEMADVQTAAIKFLRHNEHVEDVTLVDFDTEVRVARFGLHDPRLVERIRMRKPGGYTAFYDALSVYLRGASTQTGQKVMVAYTDGVDTRSSMRPGELAELLKGSDVTMYALGYLQRQSSNVQRTAQMELQRFSTMTGGQAFFPTSLKELDSIYDRIHGEIAARYILGYTSTDDRPDGSWRPVEIRLKRDDLRGARLRTRPGYFAAYEPAAAPGSH